MPHPITKLVMTPLLIACLGMDQANAHPAPTNLPDSVIGAWINPKGSVKVQTGGCGEKLCGWVMWSNTQASQDARDGGVAKLVGTELLENYRQTSPRRWQGQVFVPDWGRHFYSTITQIDGKALKISGCIMGGLICKSQIWRRVA